MPRHAALCLLLLGACRNEPSFEERYAAAEDELTTLSAEIEKDLEANASGSNDRERSDIQHSDQPGRHDMKEGQASIN